MLRTNVTEWTPEALWRTYIQLTEAEAEFRLHKSELSIRTIWHQRQDRVLAHILLCFLVYVLWKTLEQWPSRAGLGNARAPSSMNSAPSTAPMSSCPPPKRRSVSRACAASCVLIAPKPHCSIALGCACPSGCA